MPDDNGIAETALVPVEPDVVAEIERRFGHRFARPELISQALTHASIADRRLDSNERLEFLGDAVLGLICCELTFDMYPNLLEGEMTKIKSAVVSRQTCAEIARAMGLETLLKLGKGMKSRTALPQSLAAAALEALIAAVYLDAGYQRIHDLLAPTLRERIQRTHSSGHQENFKSVLQQHAQEHFTDSPSYIVLDEKGPDHSKCFEICVEIGSRRFPSSWGQSKKQAEQQAALLALQELGVTADDGDGRIRVVIDPNGAEPKPGV